MHIRPGESDPPLAAEFDKGDPGHREEAAFAELAVDDGD